MLTSGTQTTSCYTVYIKTLDILCGGGGFVMHNVQSIVWQIQTILRFVLVSSFFSFFKLPLLFLFRLLLYFPTYHHNLYTEPI